MNNDWFHEYFINELKAIGRKPTSNMQHEVVDSLPSSGNEQTIYFVKNDSSSSNNHYDEYVWISSSSTFEKIGSTQIDGSTAQPDWNQNDATQPDYVKNRPFYTGDPVETVFVEESAVAFEENEAGYRAEFETTFVATVGETYKVYWDGTVYECACINFSDATVVIGNLSIVGAGADSGEPFVMAGFDGRAAVIYAADTASSHTISISGMVAPVVKIDEKYLPDTLATKSDAEYVESIANNAQNTANNAQNTANNAQNTANNAQTTANNNREVLNGTFNSVATFTFDKQTSGKDTFVFNAYKYYKISDFNPAPDDVISFTGTRESGGDLSTITTGNNCAEYGFFIVVASAGDCSIPITETTTFSFTASSAGLYARYEKGKPHMTAGTGEFTLRWPIEILLRSSQSYNTKQFKMVIDDSGIIKIINTSDGTEAQLTQTDEHINELINTALSKIGIAEEGAY